MQLQPFTALHRESESRPRQQRSSTSLLRQDMPPICSFAHATMQLFTSRHVRSPYPNAVLALPLMLRRVHQTTAAVINVNVFVTIVVVIIVITHANAPSSLMLPPHHPLRPPLPLLSPDSSHPEVAYSPQPSVFYRDSHLAPPRQDSHCSRFS